MIKKKIIKKVILKKEKENLVIKKIKKIIEQIRPLLQIDGGDVHFVKFDEKSGALKVELMGHCSHCPMSQITLKRLIEEKIKKQISEVKEVIAVRI